MMTKVTTKGPSLQKCGADFRFGRWEDVLADVEADALICDPPYSSKTHKGHDQAVRELRSSSEKGRTRVDRRDGAVHFVGESRRSGIDFDAWGEDDVRAFVEHWSPRVRGWMVVMSDDVLSSIWKRAFSDVGRYVFPRVPYVAPGATVRLSGDGPSSWAVDIIVARPKGRLWCKWGTLRGAYWLPKGAGERGLRPGQKPIWIMRELVKDYSRQGDIVIDPCAGRATTLLAAMVEGRCAIGSEQSELAYNQGVEFLDGHRRKKDLVEGFMDAMGV